jgi:hypothetical protein
MRSWAREAIGGLPGASVFYPFSGPDIATALALFGDASRLVLVARQPASVDDLAQPGAEVAAAECETQRFFSRTGFFRTHDLEGKDRPAAPRVLALLLMGIEAAGGQALSIMPLQVTPEGTLSEHRARQIFADAQGSLARAGIDASEGAQPPPGADSLPSGVRIDAVDSLGRAQQIDYISLDLSNRGLRPGSSAHEWVQSEADEITLIKSASHLLQSPHFTQLAEMITSRTRLLVQDETGLDVRALDRFARLDVHGQFTEPHDLWRESESMARLKEYVGQIGRTDSPPFPFGYRKPSGTFIMIGSDQPSAQETTGQASR